MAVGDGLTFLNQWNMPRQGWQCPCCKAVFSPDTVSCWNCRPIAVTTAPNTNATPTFPTDWEIVADGTGYTVKKKA